MAGQHSREYPGRECVHPDTGNRPQQQVVLGLAGLHLARQLVVDDKAARLFIGQVGVAGQGAVIGRQRRVVGVLLVGRGIHVAGVCSSCQLALKSWLSL